MFKASLHTKHAKYTGAWIFYIFGSVLKYNYVRRNSYTLILLMFE